MTSRTSRQGGTDVKLVRVQLPLANPPRLLLKLYELLRSCLLGRCCSFCSFWLTAQQSFPLALQQLPVQLLVL